jgi:MoaA/NifB/PqqE/SkfB family radical SAM enzyme
MTQAKIDKMKKVLTRHKLNPETFCLAPYTTTDLDQLGHIRTCYRGKDNLGSWKEESFKEVFNNEKYKKIRSSLFNGEKPSNCKSCWMAEAHNAISPRVNIFYDALDHIEDLDNLIKQIKKDATVGNLNDLVRIEIRPSLLCNMRCMHCGPYSSTRWIEKLTDKQNFETYTNTVGRVDNDDDNIENIKITNENINSYFKNGLSSDSNHKEEVKELLSSTKEIQFAGGEPLLTPEHEDWLQYLVNDAKTSKTQFLSYNSNFNVKNIEKYFPYWKEFKLVTIRASIDTSFDSYEYFRADGDILTLKSNIEKFHSFFKNDNKVSLSGTVTFNMFSALSWKNIFHDWISNGLKFHASLVLNHPTSVIMLPNNLKEQVLEDIEYTIRNVSFYTDDQQFIKQFTEHATNCMEYLKNSNRDYLTIPTKTRTYIEMCDKINNKNVFDYFPELQKFWYE